MSEEAERERGAAIAQEINRAVTDFVTKVGPLTAEDLRDKLSEYLTGVVRIAVNTATPLIWNYAVDTVAESFDEGDPNIGLSGMQMDDVASWIRSQKY